MCNLRSCLPQYESRYHYCYTSFARLTLFSNKLTCCNVTRDIIEVFSNKLIFCIITADILEVNIAFCVVIALLFVTSCIIAGSFSYTA